MRCYQLFSVCCPLCSVWPAESYSTQGLAYGGPVVMVWGWIVVSFFSLVIAACLAELVSAFPTSGGLYYWSWILAPSK